MELQPMKRYHGPAYPTRDVLDAQPELLRIVPRRWTRNTVVLSALATTGLLISAQWARADDAPQASRVAPIFTHGEGRGAFGCMSVNPPVFLSEAEARAVITDEAKKAGIVFAADTVSLEHITVPMTDRFAIFNEAKDGIKNKKPKTMEVSVLLDGTDAAKNISYEYVSEPEFRAWETKEHTIIASVSGYDVKAAATGLRDGLTQAKPAGAYGVFYDPVTPTLTQLPKAGEPPVDWQTTQADAQTRAKDELRQQVRDFIAWLKAEHVI